MPLKVKEGYRLRDHPLFGSDASYGNNGFFVIQHPHIKHFEFRCVVSNNMGWERVSVMLSHSSVQNKGLCEEESVRPLTCDEVVWIKNMFWHDGDTVVQYINSFFSKEPFCVHLWRSLHYPMPMPDYKMLIGL